MRYPTDPKLLWEGIEKSYETMCEVSKRQGIHRPRTKYLDVQKANLVYRKQRKRSKSQNRKMTRRLLELLGKILKEIRKMEREMDEVRKLLTVREKVDLDIITKMYRQQKKHFQSKDCRESIKDRIVSITKSYVRPIVGEKEVKRGRPFSEEKKEKDLVRRELARVRATAMEGSFGTQKEHYDLKRVKARTKLTEILYIFFGIHTANVVQLAARIEQRTRLSAA